MKQEINRPLVGSKAAGSGWNRYRKTKLFQEVRYFFLPPLLPHRVIRRGIYFWNGLIMTYLIQFVNVYILQERGILRYDWKMGGC
jgi:hypothetical protein